MSVYKNGTENAWVTFSKNPEDLRDNWFRSIRVLDSYPWNTTKLQASTTVYESNLASQDMFWLISEGYEHNSGAIGSFSAHAHWLVYKRSHKCDLMADTELPVILYNKGSMIISLLMNIDEYYNEPIGRSFGNCDIYNTTITWLRKHDHMARYFPIFLVFGAKFQYFDNGE